MLIDITAPKVLTPTLLFALLSPVFLFSIPPESNLYIQVCMHGLLLCILNAFIIKYGFQLNLTTADIIVPGVLFTLLTPGVFFSIPQQSHTALGVHSLVYALVWAFLRGKFPEYA
jgi:hypothetical protein